MIEQTQMAFHQQAPAAAHDFEQCLRELEEGGRDLQQALFKRKPEAIWQAVEKQEQTMQRLNDCYRAYSTSPRPTPSAAAPEPAGTGNDSTIKEIARRIRQVQRTNKTLAVRFLDVIDRTLAGLSSFDNEKPLVYDQTGRIGRFSAPLLVQQQG